MDENLTVHTKCGKVRGIRQVSSFNNKVFYSFLGIPYAEKPSGDRRFRKPVPKQRWDNVLDASKDGDECIQFSFTKLQVTGSEDCLHLNVNVPEVPSKIKQPKAVVVLIHPGAVLWGANARDVHGNPDYVMHQDIVYVTINYRLHFLGFLNLNIRECAGNAGLKDIVLTLQWIKENIRKFGGDPNNVTLLGSSSSGILIHCLMLSPVAKGLYHKVILMGMYVFHPFLIFEENARALAFKFGKMAGYQGSSAAELLTFLRRQNEVTLLSIGKQLFDELEKTYKRVNPSSSFFPSVERPSKEAIFDRCPLQLINTTNPVPVIFGICHRENIFVQKPILRSFVENDFKAVYRQQRWNWLRNLDDNTMNQIEREVKNRYYLNLTKDDRLNAAVEAQTDLIASEFYDTVADVIHKISPQTPVYVYKFEYMGELNYLTNLFHHNYPDIPITGSAHADDINYWLKNVKNPDVPNAEDAAMVETVTKLFTNFAKTGNPNDENSKVYWHPSTPENPCFLSIDQKLDLVKTKLNASGVEFWQDIKKRFAQNKTHSFTVYEIDEWRLLRYLQSIFEKSTAFIVVEFGQNFLIENDGSEKRKNILEELLNYCRHYGTFNSPRLLFFFFLAHSIANAYQTFGKERSKTHRIK